jgi:Tol biopolymer transport system component
MTYHLPTFRIAHASTLAASVLLAAASAAQVAIEPVNLTDAGNQANGSVGRGLMTPDGRYVVFTSTSTNLVPGFSLGKYDVYVRDRLLGTTKFVSLTSAGGPSYQWCFHGGISDDGRYVVFESSGNDIVPGDDNLADDVFVRDLVAGTTTRVSVGSAGVQGNGPSSVAVAEPCISGDGRFVAFYSLASNLASNDTNYYHDVFVHDRSNATTQCVSIGVNGNSGNEHSYLRAISGDGNAVAFFSYATNLLPGVGDGYGQIYVRDLALGATDVVSVASTGELANLQPQGSRLSHDGRKLVFWSNATNLVDGDSNAVSDVFLRDLDLKTTERVSLGLSGQELDGPSRFASISRDERFVVFEAFADNHGLPDTGGFSDVLRLDLETGIVERASLAYDGGEPDADSSCPELSGDGQLVLFFSAATNLLAAPDGNPSSELFVRGALCSTPEVYCTPKVNSQGCTPTIYATGVPDSDASYGGFRVHAKDVLNQQSGLLIWSYSPGNATFGGGVLCLSGTVVRTGGQHSGGSGSPQVDCSGTYAFQFTPGYQASAGMFPGVTVYTQYWSRDPGFAAPQNMGLTAGLQFTVCN